jgi:hypothetical protein
MVSSLVKSNFLFVLLDNPSLKPLEMYRLAACMIYLQMKNVSVCLPSSKRVIAAALHRISSCLHSSHSENLSLVEKYLDGEPIMDESACITILRDIGTCNKEILKNGHV